jgi:hypothetical protein
VRLKVDSFAEPSQLAQRYSSSLYSGGARLESAEIPTTLNEILRGFPQFRHANAVVVH